MPIPPSALQLIRTQIGGFAFVLGSPYVTAYREGSSARVGYYCRAELPQPLRHYRAAPATYAATM